MQIMSELNQSDVQLSDRIEEMKNYATIMGNLYGKEAVDLDTASQTLQHSTLLIPSNVILVDEEGQLQYIQQNVEWKEYRENWDEIRQQEVYVDRDGKQLFITIPIEKKSGDKEYLSCFYSYSVLEELLEKQQYQKHMVHSLLDQEGKIIASTEKNKVKLDYLEKIFTKMEHNLPELRIVSVGQQNTNQLLFTYLKTPYYIYTCENSLTGFTMVALTRKRELSSSIQTVRNAIRFPVAILLLLIITLAAIMIYFHFKVVRIKDKSNDALFIEKERYRVTTEGMDNIIFEYYSTEDSFYISNNLKDIFCVSKPKTIKEFETYLHPDDREQYFRKKTLLELGSCEEEMELRLVNQQETRWFRGKVTSVRTERMGNRVIGKLEDIQKEKEELEALSILVEKDAMTQVYNKVSTIRKIDELLAEEQKEGRQGKHAYYFIDIDNFKKVNDTLGHKIGDQLILLLVDCMQTVFTQDEIIGRFGGDEFIVFVKNYKDQAQLKDLAEQLAAKIEKERASCQMLSVTIGIACYPEDGTTNEEIMEKADQALYIAKKAGKNQYHFIHQR